MGGKRFVFPIHQIYEGLEAGVLSIRLDLDDPDGGTALVEVSTTLDSESSMSSHSTGLLPGGRRHLECPPKTLRHVEAEVVQGHVLRSMCSNCFCRTVLPGSGAPPVCDRCGRYEATGGVVAFRAGRYVVTCTCGGEIRGSHRRGRFLGSWTPEAGWEEDGPIDIPVPPDWTRLDAPPATWWTGPWRLAVLSGNHRHRLLLFLSDTGVRLRFDHEQGGAVAAGVIPAGGGSVFRLGDEALYAHAVPILEGVLEALQDDIDPAGPGQPLDSTAKVGALWARLEAKSAG